MALLAAPALHILQRPRMILSAWIWYLEKSADLLDEQSPAVAHV
jgi:hypothetical protein